VIKVYQCFVELVGKEVEERIRWVLTYCNKLNDGIYDKQELQAKFEVFRKRMHDELGYTIYGTPMFFHYQSKREDRCKDTDGLDLVLPLITNEFEMRLRDLPWQQDQIYQLLNGFKKFRENNNGRGSPQLPKFEDRIQNDLTEECARICQKYQLFGDKAKKFLQMKQENEERLAIRAGDLQEKLEVEGNLEEVKEEII
jgi:hypothetical protein